jgi:hypothetical protein
MIITDIYSFVVIHICWVTVHYISAHLYARHCTPWSVAGIAFSPVMTMAPHCQSLRWCIVQGATSINSMWITLGTWCVSKLAYVSMICPDYTKAKCK